MSLHVHVFSKLGEWEFLIFYCCYPVGIGLTGTFFIGIVRGQGRLILKIDALNYVFIPEQK